MFPKYLSVSYDYVKKHNVNFKVYDVTNWKNDCNTHIAQYYPVVKWIKQWNLVS